MSFVCHKVSYLSHINIFGFYFNKLYFSRKLIIMKKFLILSVILYSCSKSVDVPKGQQTDNTCYECKVDSVVYRNWQNPNAWVHYTTRYCGLSKEDVQIWATTKDTLFHEFQWLFVKKNCRRLY